MSQCFRMSESPPSTYPLDTDPTNFDGCLSANPEDEISSVWGRLIPICTNLDVKVFDLEEDTYLFGRQITCDVVFSKENMCEDHIKVISKLHFKISRSKLTSIYVVYLEDLSSNGTYINGEKIGKGSKSPLQNNDVISLALPKVKVFVYTDMLKDDDVIYPQEIKSKYTITRELGSGACGKVRLIFRKDTCKMFAMKIIQKSKYSSGGVNDPKKVRNEVRILKALYHPCVIEIEDFVDTQDQCFIILSLAEGGDLMKYITEKEFLSEKETKKIFYQVVLAVQYLHSKGITHRDLKPQNILLTGEGHDSLVKITDFGLSKTFENSLLEKGFSFSGSSNCGGVKNCLMQTVCGSPLYVAPEVLASQYSISSGQSSSGYTHKVDIWSMGVILYICLSGWPPFMAPCEYDDIKCPGEASDHEECHIKNVHRQRTLQSAILNGEYSFPKKLWKGISGAAMDLVRKMLTVDPNKRITIEEILNHAWLQDDAMRTKVHSLMDQQSSGCLQELSGKIDSVDTKQRLSLKRRRPSEDDDET